MLKFFLTVVLMLAALLLIGLVGQSGPVTAQTIQPPHNVPDCPGINKAGRPLTGQTELDNGQLRCVYGYAHEDGECYPTNGRRRPLVKEVKRPDQRIACFYGAYSN